MSHDLIHEVLVGAVRFAWGFAIGYCLAYCLVIRKYRKGGRDGRGQRRK